MAYHKLIYIMLSLFLLSSCASEEPEYFIEDALMPYFLTFQAEGELRGIKIDFQTAGIFGYIDQIAVDDVVGQCSHSEATPNRVTIDPIFWQKASTSRKEFVIFHELGHCYLKRGHLDDTDARGNCLSIMQSSAEACKSTYESNREQYLDELFSST